MPATKKARAGERLAVSQDVPDFLRDLRGISSRSLRLKAF
jgi:hypothetical protein